MTLGSPIAPAWCLLAGLALAACVPEPAPRVQPASSPFIGTTVAPGWTGPTGSAGDRAANPRGQMEMLDRLGRPPPPAPPARQ